MTSFAVPCSEVPSHTPRPRRPSPHPEIDMPKTFAALCLAATLLAPSAANAQQAQRIAAEQVAIDRSAVYSLVPQSGQFAQVFRLPRAGSVRHVMLPITCSAGDQIEFTIVDAPGGIPSASIRQFQRVDGVALDATLAPSGEFAMRLVEFTQPMLLAAGQYALTITHAGGRPCALYRAPPGDHYPGGDGYYRSSATGAWFAQSRDLGFQLFYQPFVMPSIR